MASTYTDAGIELIGVGEQANVWGQTTNTNWRLVEELATGVVSINLTGLSSFNLTTTNGVTSNGRHFVVEFTGTPGATCTVTVNPDDLQKVYIINNLTDQIVTVTQGSGGDVDVPAGSKKIVYCDGGGSGAEVTDVTENLSLSGEVNVTTFSIDGTEVTATAAELNTLDGVLASTAELNVLNGIAATTDEINKLDGFTGLAADLNYAKDLRATGVTTTEFDLLDGITASTSEINTLDGLTASTAELNKLDGVTASTTEINTLDGVTSGIQGQLDDKADDSTTISAGAGLTGGGSLAANRTISHADTSSQGSVNNSGNTFVQDISVDTYGHITGINSGSPSINFGSVQITGYVNNFDRDVNYTTPDGSVLVGEFSTHRNNNEDRRFRFRYRSISV